MGKVQANPPEGGSHSSLGFVLGVAAGVVLGVLLAPVEGEKARRVLRRKSGELKSQLGDAAASLRAESLSEEVAAVIEKQLSRVAAKEKEAVKTPAKKSGSSTKKSRRRLFKGIKKR